MGRGGMVVMIAASPYFASTAVGWVAASSPQDLGMVSRHQEGLAKRWGIWHNPFVI